MMMANKKIYLALLSGLLFGAGRSDAQNFNPTVSVTRAYEGKLMEVHKPSIEMNVPDSLTKFNLDFDYSVFENPYKGSYDFKPYTLDMKPVQEPYSGRSLYLKAGAGWLMRPYMDFVWEPQFKKRFRMSLYATHRSFIGKYGIEGLDAKSNIDLLDGKMDGYDMETRAGIRGRADFDKGFLSFDAGYQGIHTKDSISAVGWNAANASLRVRSVNPGDTYFFYDAGIYCRYGTQGVAPSGCLKMSDIDFLGSFGPVVRQHNSFLVDLGVGVTAYSSLFSSTNGVFSVTPKYVIDRSRWNMTLGAQVALRLGSGDVFNGSELNTGKGQIVYPDVHIGIKAVKDYLNIYLSATGGLDRNSYASLKEKRHFFNPYYSTGFGPMSQNTVERFNLAAGLEGNISGKFRYDVRFGYVSYKDAPVDAVYYSSNTLETVMLPALAFKTFDLVYSDILLQWESRDVSVDSRFHIKSSNLDEHIEPCFEPSFFSGDLKAKYNYKKRIFASVTADFASRRSGFANNAAISAGEDEQIIFMKCHIPAYVNLGAELEFALTRTFSLWLRGDNLLNMNVQRSPFHYQGGIGLTAGICLNL
ncbi:MAG: hypothetical protein PUA96_02845 [Bacteroidales bacterium]|nr:hypothetical protein [Bacteroidales bacterium]